MAGVKIPRYTNGGEASSIVDTYSVGFLSGPFDSLNWCRCLGGRTRRKQASSSIRDLSNRHHCSRMVPDSSPNT